MSSRLLSLPHEVLLLLATHLCRLEDFGNLSLTCKEMRSILADALPNTFLRIAVRQSFYSPFPSSNLLVAATARKLGNWARESTTNEETLATACQGGFEGLLGLALRQCSLTMSQLRELQDVQYSIVNPVVNIIDQCIGEQWRAIPDFWSGGASDAASISTDASDAFFHIAVYGELFAPDIETYLDGNQTVPSQRPLTLDTRLEYIKYCVPDKACWLMSEDQALSAAARGVPIDPRREVKNVGPYAGCEDRSDRRSDRHSEFDDDEPRKFYFDENDEIHFLSSQNVSDDGSSEPQTNLFTDDAFNNAIQNHFFGDSNEEDEFAENDWFGQNNGFNNDNDSDDNAREPREPLNDNNFALVWLLDSSRWRPHWQEARRRLGRDFDVTYRDLEHFTADDPGNWRQRLWENTMLCQGLEGLGMILPGQHDAWRKKIRRWRRKIAKMTEEPRMVVLGEQITYDYPYLFGELRICGQGFVGATR
ncbi:unnamed protein product [Clonostachys byssicola]|uniref:F-box domain-containing protein n=1 Tax=Clonostachys byssicola TaxID=160290 RepID=A0A9N9ULK1_9HYPO|nr:unnamed protein product [Clonostachys byssicola]